MDTVQLLEALWRGSLLFITKFQEIPGTLVFLVWNKSLFHVTDLFISPENIGFLMFPGGRKSDLWHEMAWIIRKK